MSVHPEVAEPILNRPFEKPSRYWYIREGEQPELRGSEQNPERRPAIIFPPKDQRDTWTLDGTVLKRSEDFPYGFELGLVNLIRERLEAWQKAGYPGVTRTTLELIQWWTREGREKRLFFAQLEAAVGDFRADWLRRLCPGNSFPAQPSVQPGAVVVHAIPPQHSVPRRTFARLAGRGGHRSCGE